MRNSLIAAALVIGLGSPAWAQEAPPPEQITIGWNDPAPESLLKDDGIAFGLRAGYLKIRDAEDGTWFGGVQVRVPLGDMFAAEGSIEFHASDFEDGDIDVVQYPVQVSLLWFILPKAQFCPYLIGGLGWWYTTVDFSGGFSSEDSTTDSMFSAHLGAGVRMGNFSADIRYHFIEPNEDALEDEEFDTFQFVLSYSFGM